MGSRSYALVTVIVVLLLVGGIIVAVQFQKGSPSSSRGTESTSTALPTTSSGTTTTGTEPSSTTSTVTSSSNSLTTGTTSSISGNLFAFQPPELVGGNAPVTGSDFASHPGDTEEWLEAKIVPTGLNGTIWYIHADFVGASNAVSGDWVNVTTDSDSSTYPQGVASFNTQSLLMVFRVTSVPPTPNGWFHDAKAGDVIECYPFSKQAFWAFGSQFYWSGNCELTTNGTTVTGLGHFIRLWQGGEGVDGNPLPTCYPDTLFEGVFSVVFTGGTIDITDVVCSGEARYQVGGILWFDNGAWDNIGAQEGQGMINYTANTGKGCNEITLTIPTSRGLLTANVLMDRYYGSGCNFEDASLSGNLTVGSTTYSILGVMSEFRCTASYC